MIRKLLILGAGFDVPAGLPTMPRFFKTAWKLLASELSGSAVGLGGHPEDFDRFLRLNELWRAWRVKEDTVSSTDLEEFSRFVERDHRDAVLDLRYVIGRTLDLAHYNWGAPHRACGGHPDWTRVYRAFAEDVLRLREEIAVVSFNYSPIFEQSLLQVGGTPEYRLLGWAPINVDPRPREPVEVLKPHGSLNWLVPVAGEPTSVVVDLVPGARDWNGGANWHTGFTYRSRDGTRFMPLVAPPSDKAGKPTASSAEDTCLDPVQRRLREVLAQIDTCFFIGWSAPVTDKEMAALLHGGLFRCKHAHVLNHAPSESLLRADLEERYQWVLSEGVAIDWDHRGMRPPAEMPGSQRFLAF